MMKKKVCTRAALSIAIVAMVGTAQAAATIRVGMLVCDIAGGPGFIIGSRKSLSCDFSRIGGPTEYYDGSILKLGVDAGLTDGTRLVWAVFAPSLQVTEGALEGGYYGVTAEATAVIGLGANVLIGGFDRSINLQPVSVQGQVGVNVAAGVAQLRLKSLPIVRKN